MLSCNCGFSAKLQAKLTYHAARRVHLCAANGREAAEEDVQLIGGNLTCQIAAKDLCDHAEEHHAARTEAARRQRARREGKWELSAHAPWRLLTI